MSTNAQVARVAYLSLFVAVEMIQFGRVFFVFLLLLVHSPDFQLIHATNTNSNSIMSTTHIHMDHTHHTSHIHVHLRLLHTSRDLQRLVCCKNGVMRCKSRRDHFVEGIIPYRVILSGRDGVDDVMWMM